MVEGIGLEIRQVAQAARGFESLLLRFSSFRDGCTILYFYLTLEKYPSWPKGHPWKGCRSLIAARGFKSLLLRSRKPVELSTGFDLLWVFVRESRALKAVLRTAASSCLRTANPGSIARRVRSIPPSPRKKRAREALFFRGESSWSLSPSAGGASETARRSSRQAKRCGCRNNPASGKAASRKGSARLRAIPPSPLTKRTVKVLFS